MEPQIRYPLQLLDVRLFEATVKRITHEDTTNSSEPEENYTAAPFLNVDADVLRIEEKNRVSVLLTIEIKGPDTDAPEFHLRFTLEGLFESQIDLAEIDEAMWQEFEQISSITLLWPYAREYTQSFSRRMRVDLPVLPTLNRLAMQEAREQKSGDGNTTGEDNN
jgi:preprotein translocase subunit SecB